MNYQATLEQLAAERGLTLTPLSELSRIATPTKISCCGGWVLCVYAESAVDSSVVLRDSGGSIVCVFHQSILCLHPDVLTTHALVLLQDVSFIPSLHYKCPSFVVVGVPHLVSLMLPEEEEEPLKWGLHNGHPDDVPNPLNEKEVEPISDYKDSSENVLRKLSSSPLGSHESEPPPQRQRHPLIFPFHPSPTKALEATTAYAPQLPVGSKHNWRDDECLLFSSQEKAEKNHDSEKGMGTEWCSKDVEQRGAFLSRSSSYSPPSTQMALSSNSLYTCEPPNGSNFPPTIVYNSIPAASEIVAARYSVFSSDLPMGLTCEEESTQQIGISQDSERGSHSECKELVDERKEVNNGAEEEEEETEEEQMEDEEDALHCLEFAD